MEPSPLDKNLIKIAGFLGIVQGLGIVALSLACIILYNTEPLTVGINNSYMESVSLQMYFYVLYSNVGFDGQTFTGNVFTGFMWIYLVFDLLWVGLSVTILVQKKTTLPKMLMGWSILTFLLCLWDFIVVVILGSDYDKCLQVDYLEITDVTSIQMACANGILPVLVIAAKGFVLWIINVIFAAILAKMTVSLKPQVFQNTALPPFHNQMGGGYQTPYATNDPRSPAYGMQPNRFGPPNRDNSFHTQMSQYGQPNAPPQPVQPPPMMLQNPPPPRNKNNNQYPVQIPEPDYQHNQYGFPSRQY